MEPPMMHVSYSELRAKFAGLMDEVCDGRAPLLVTRQNARSVVMVSEEDYASRIETVHLLRSPANAARLLASMAEADKGALVEHDLIEPKDASAS
jgi:antitoxin YefM